MNSFASSPLSLSNGSTSPSPFVHSPLPVRKPNSLFKKSQSTKAPILDFTDADVDYEFQRPSRFLVDKLRKLSGESSSQEDSDYDVYNGFAAEICSERRTISERLEIGCGMIERPISRAVNAQAFDQAFQRNN